MQSEAADDTPDATIDDNLKVVVTFRFEEQWHIGRVDESSEGVTPDTRVRFPAGGGLTPGRGILIAPVHLQGLSFDEVAKIIRHRAEDMAMLAEAITIANIQFREALDSIASDPEVLPENPA